MKTHLVLGLIGLFALGCSDSDHGSDSNDPHAGHSAGSGGSAGSSGAGGSVAGSAGGGASGAAGTPGTAAPLAPTLTELMPMTGALHVMWTNNEPACDTIEGERKSPTEDFKVVFSVPGEADNKHDGTATEPVEYTYRLRCKKGDQVSPYSAEMTGKPKE